jgi:hypothetical protein
MANISYQIIDTPQLLINGHLYIVATFQMTLKDFLLEHAGNDIYIYRPSLGNERIRAIIVKK